MSIFHNALEEAIRKRLGGDAETGPMPEPLVIRERELISAMYAFDPKGADDNPADALRYIQSFIEDAIDLVEAEPVLP